MPMQEFYMKEKKIVLENGREFYGQGFGAAVNAFIAQNFGAGRIDRVKGCYIAAVKLMIAWGIIATGILYFGSGPLYRIFLHEEELIPLGANYMRIIAYGELFVCIELMTNGALSQNPGWDDGLSF